jgi:hypothetical protein
MRFMWSSWLYGGDDSGRCFYDLWVDFHKAMGFKSIVHDMAYLSYAEGPGSWIKFVFHTDDNYYFHKGEALWLKYKSVVKAKFLIEFVDLEDGQSAVFAGTRISRDVSSGFVSIDQRSHIKKVLRSMGWEDIKERDVPIVQTFPTADDKPVTAEEKDEASKHPYLETNGNLGWVSNIHMDVTLAYKLLASRTHDHGAAAWSAMKWLWGYLRKGTYAQLLLRQGPRGINRTISNSASIPTQRGTQTRQHGGL